MGCPSSRDFSATDEVVDEAGPFAEQQEAEAGIETTFGKWFACGRPKADNSTDGPLTNESGDKHQEVERGCYPSR